MLKIYRYGEWYCTVEGIVERDDAHSILVHHYEDGSKTEFLKEKGYSLTKQPQKPQARYVGDIKINSKQIEAINSYFSAYINGNKRQREIAEKQGDKNQVAYRNGAIDQILGLYRELFGVDCPIENLEE